ncbi:hypothetical protein [Caloranaerobacter sp. DY30410]|uniref:hypothetical protein n=1 Tax=Caloranaerobacter sp. DY30410 TaxID=3238305 RepID=UPI003D017D91
MDKFWDILKTIIAILLPIIFSNAFNKDKRKKNREYSSGIVSDRGIRQDYELIFEEDDDETEQVEFVYIESSETNQEKEVYIEENVKEERVIEEKLEDKRDDVIKQNEISDESVFRLDFNSDDIIKGIIMAEILSKPKSLR